MAYGLKASSCDPVIHSKLLHTLSEKYVNITEKSIKLDFVFGLGNTSVANNVCFPDYALP